MVSLFLSTPSARRATHQRALERTAIKISIHALREEGDKSACTNLAEAGNFYPRPPRGGRRDREIDARKKARKFLSTPSARRATYIEYVLLKHLEISIHALREEGDRFFR